jgi:molybdopterin synthase catalytic subunit
VKRYLNKAERQMALSLSAYEAYLEEKISEMAQHNGDKGLLKNMRMAKTYLHKALECMVQPLDAVELQVLLRDVNKMQVVVKYTDEAIREYERMKKMNGVTVIETEAFLDIVEQAINVCVTCENTGEAVNQCKWRKRFIEAEIEPPDYGAVEGKCPYKYKD